MSCETWTCTKKSLVLEYNVPASLLRNLASSIIDCMNVIPSAAISVLSACMEKKYEQLVASKTLET